MSEDQNEIISEARKSIATLEKLVAVADRINNAGEFVGMAADLDRTAGDLGFWQIVREGNSRIAFELYRLSKRIDGIEARLNAKG